LIETLANRILVDESVTTDVLKIARCLNKNHIKQIHKLFIYLREQNDIAGVNTV